MTEEKIIDVSNCPHKSDDDCMEVPICNEYGDLMGYQSCEAQILCPYRSQKKIERLEQENKELLEARNHFMGVNLKYFNALEEIREIVNEPCIEDEDCETCDSNCMCKEILTRINEVLK